MNKLLNNAFKRALDPAWAHINLSPPPNENPGSAPDINEIIVNVIQIKYINIFGSFEMKWNEMKWNEMKWNEMEWNEMKWNEMKWIEMKWNETKWSKMKWNEMKWNEMKWNEMKWNEMK